MRALAIDTSTHRAEVALSDGGRCVARAENVEPGKHAESLISLIDRVFEIAGWRKTDLDLIVPGIGPGSFTGVRVALATAKGIALALDRPIVGVCGLEAMASALGAREPELVHDIDAVVALLDARKGEIFWASYGREGELLGGPAHVAAGKFSELLRMTPRRKVLVGAACEMVASDLTMSDARVYRGAGTDLPDAGELARLGIRRHEETGPDDVDLLEPIYVRPPDITLPRPK